MKQMMGIGIAIVVIIIVAAAAYFLMSQPATPVASTTVATTVSPVTTVASGSQSGNTSSSGGTNSTKTYTINVAYNAAVGGNYLVNATGWTLYLYTSDTPSSGKSTCYATCATYWPVLYYPSNLTVAPSLNASAFGFINRTDGTKQLTYMGWPLYYYAGDHAAGQTSGQGSGGTWYVLNVPKLNIPGYTSTTTVQQIPVGGNFSTG